MCCCLNHFALLDGPSTENAACNGADLASFTFCPSFISYYGRKKLVVYPESNFTDRVALTPNLKDSKMTLSLLSAKMVKWVKLSHAVTWLRLGK